MENEKVDAICQTLALAQTQNTDRQTQTEDDRSTGQDTECQTTASIEEEYIPMFRKNLRKVMDVSFLAAATRRDRNLLPLLNMVKQQRWDNLKDCYGPYFYNVRHRLSVRENILLYDDRVVIPKQLRPTLMDALHLTHPGQGGMLEAAKHVWYPIINYFPHTAWIREDGKQPRVIRHDGLAFIPDPRVYGKNRPAALKDFVAYKHLPRAKPHVSGKKTPINEAQGGKTAKLATSPKRPPPKTTQEIIQQKLNRRALGPKKLLRPFTTKSKINAREKRDKSEPSTQRIHTTIPQGKGSPKKKSKVDLTKIQFECDTSISLSSDTDLDHKTPSPSKQPAAKRIDLKSTPEPHSPEIRRSARTRKSTLAGKFGNAIPIGSISTNTETLITVATIQDSNTNDTTANKPNNPTMIDNPNIQPTTMDEGLAVSPSTLSQTPEDILCTEVHINSDTPENARETAHTDKSPPRTTSSRYILDKPRITEDSFSKNSEDAMNVLQSISPIRGNSMTFQREKEQISQKSIKQHSPDTTIRGNQQATEVTGKVDDNQQEEDTADTF